MEVPYSTLGKTQNFSFSKSKRFNDVQKALGREFINYSDPFKTRSCSFGYGKRSKLLNEWSVATPSPATYSISPEPRHCPIFISRPSWKFGFERNSKSPGPGSYAIDNNTVEFHRFSQAKRELYTFNKYPGPGTYKPVLGLTEKGTVGGFIAKSRKEIPISERKKKSSPGPGSYKIASCFGEDKLRYPVIKYKRRH